MPSKDLNFDSKQSRKLIQQRLIPKTCYRHKIRVASGKRKKTFLELILNSISK